jgi:hypothetical protein
MNRGVHHLRFDKQNKESSIETTLYRCRALLAGELREISIIAFTKRRAEEAYRARVDAGVSAATRHRLRASCAPRARCGAGSSSAAGPR